MRSSREPRTSSPEVSIISTAALLAQKKGAKPLNPGEVEAIVSEGYLMV